MESLIFAGYAREIELPVPYKEEPPPKPPEPTVQQLEKRVSEAIKNAKWSDALSTIASMPWSCISELGEKAVFNRINEEVISGKIKVSAVEHGEKLERFLRGKLKNSEVNRWINAAVRRMRIHQFELLAEKKIYREMGFYPEHFPYDKKIACNAKFLEEASVSMRLAQILIDDLKNKKLTNADLLKKYSAWPLLEHLRPQMGGALLNALEERLMRDSDDWADVWESAQKIWPNPLPEEGWILEKYQEFHQMFPMKEKPLEKGKKKAETESVEEDLFFEPEVLKYILEELLPEEGKEIDLGAIRWIKKHCWNQQGEANAYALKALGRIARDKKVSAALAFKTWARILEQTTRGVNPNEIMHALVDLHTRGEFASCSVRFQDAGVRKTMKDLIEESWLDPYSAARKCKEFIEDSPDSFQFFDQILELIENVTSTGISLVPIFEIASVAAEKCPSPFAIWWLSSTVLNSLKTWPSSSSIPEYPNLQLILFP